MFNFYRYILSTVIAQSYLSAYKYYFYTYVRKTKFKSKKL